MAKFNAHWFRCSVRPVSWSPRRSIREMVRQYREELSCQTASNDLPLRSDECPAKKFFKNEEIDCEKRPSSPNKERHAGTKRLKDKRHVCWHDSLTSSVTQENTCAPLRFNTDDLRDFQDLDRRATDVLRRSQQVIGGRACKSSEALSSKSGHPVNYIQIPSYFTGNGHSSPCSSGTAEMRCDKNQCRARDVVARNFEEIDQILGESNLVMEQSSSSDIQHKASEYTKVGKEIREAFKESEFLPGRSPYGGAKHSKQDMEAREEAAIKAANYYLHKCNGDSDIQSEKLFENPLARTEENLASNCRRSLNAPDGTMGSADQAYYPSAFNTNRQQEWQMAMSLPFAALESCKGTKVCDKSVPITTSVNPIFHSEIKWPRNAECDRQWFNSRGRLDSERVDFASFVESKDAWKYAEEANFGESHLDSTKSLESDGELSMSSRNSVTTLSQRPLSTVDSELYPFSTKEKSMNESSKIRDVCSIQMPASLSSCSGQASGVPDPNVPVSESWSCTEKMVKGVSHGSLCLEDGMRQLSTEDLLLALENPRKIRASLKALSSKDQVDTSCEGQRTYQPEQYLSPGKCSTSLTTTEFERSFAGSLDGKDELTYSAILASPEQDYEEAFDWISPRASGSHRYLLKSNPAQRSKVRHPDPATQLLSSSSKCRGTKDRDNKSPPWMHSLNVRKPTKWRAISVTHTRLQASAASLIKGTVVEELEELGFRHNRPKDTILAAAVNSNFKGRAQEDLSCRITTASIPNIDSVIHFSRKTGNPTHAPVYTKIFETRKADDGQTSRGFFSRVSKRITNGAAQILVTTTSSDQAGIQVDDSIAHCSDSFLNQWIHGSGDFAQDFAYGIPLPRESTVQENHCVTNRLVAQEDSRFDHQPRNSAIPSGLDYLISEVVHEWVEICSAPSPVYFACDGSQEISTMSPHTTCSISSEVSTNRPVSEDGSSSPERKLEIMNGMQVSEAGKSSANLEHFRKVQRSKSLPRDSDVVKDVRKTSIAALASVVQPLLAALQEAQIEESIVTEFEADETVRLLLEKLQLYETKIRALKNRSKSKT